MPLWGSGLFRDGAILTLFSKYAWYRRTGYPHAEAAMKARWRAGLLPVVAPAESGRLARSAVASVDVPSRSR